MTAEKIYQRVGRVAVFAVDNPPVNALSHKVRQSLVDAVRALQEDTSAEALVILGAGKTFIAGADIREFGKPMQAPVLATVISEIEGSSKAVIAAIHGTALGGGFELALACHFRVALRSAKLGLPEVKLGILPGAGGTQRLPRLIGVEAALRMIVEGSEIGAEKALALAALDEIVDGDLRAGAIAFAERIIEEKRPLRRTSELAVKLDDPQVFDEMRREVEKKQRGFVAPLECIRAVQMACELPFAEATKREYEMCVELLRGPQSHALRHIFAAERAVTKLPGLPEDTPARALESAAVLGTGTMATGIALCFASIDVPVVLRGRSQESNDKAMAAIRKTLTGSVARGRLTQEQMDRRLAFIQPSLEDADLANADFIVEAVVEDLGVKKEVFARLGRICKAGAVLATNTSYLDVDVLAQSSARARDVLGTHFFNPAPVMKLLEIVRGAQTAPDAVATALKLASRLRKIPVVTGICDGFVGNRILAKRSRECFFMLEEGAMPWQVDRALTAFGFPMGPYAVADLAGLDVGWANRKSRLQRLSERERACDILDQVCELGRFGQKTGAGYYRYDEKRRPTPDPEIEALIVRHSARRGIERRSITDEEIVERCLFAMINEGARILEEGVVSRPHEIDVTWVHGLAFPRYRGGPMFYADQLGLSAVHEGLLRYSERIGAEFFTPAPLLERLASGGKGFYDR